MEIISIKKGESSESVITALTDTLKIVKEGGIINCAIVLISKEGHVSDVWANDSNPYAMVGALSVLTQEFTDNTIDKR